MSSIGEKALRLDRLFAAAKSALGRGKKATGSGQPRGTQAQAHMGRHSFQAAQDAYVNPKPLAGADKRSEGAPGRPSARDNFLAEHGGSPIPWDRKDPKAGNALLRHNALRTPNALGSMAPARRRATTGASLRPSRADRSSRSSFDASLLDADSPLQRLAQQAKAQRLSLAQSSSSSEREGLRASEQGAVDVDEWAKFG